MAFADKREYAYWLDQSGNNNDWTSNNLTESDISVDSPTNNFATMNPLKQHIGYISTFSEGNLKVAPNRYYGGSSTMAMTTGKWYAEFLLTDATGNGYLGIVPTSTTANDSIFDNVAYAYQGSNGTVRDHGSNRSSWGASYTTGDIIGIAVDMDNSNVYFSKNNTWQDSGNPTSGATGTGSANASDIVADTYEFLVGDTSGASSGSWVANFGQDSSFAGNETAQSNQDSNNIGDFYYEPPTGFLALCTSNLPDVDVVPSEHFNTVLYTGNSTSGRAINGVGFQPDFVWFKARSGSEPHLVVDAVRGAKRLLPNTDVAEANATITFETDGVTVGTNSSNNDNNVPYVSWNWKANGSGSSNTNGSITSTVSANVDAGFSIISYTGTDAAATVGHGLSKKPELIIFKNRDNSSGASDWDSYVSSLGATKFISLNLTNTASTSVTRFNDTEPTATLIHLKNSYHTNYDTIIAYAFHSVDGYSKVGSYNGNDNADGTFVYTGFRPAWVMVKNTTNTGEGFVIMNNKSDPSNVVGTYQTVYSAAAEQGTAGTTSSRSIDFLSNGFKLRGNSTEVNEDTPIIYIAFAETPFKYSNAR
jgi:hypothetical protein